MYRIYAPQWLTVHTSLATGQEGRDECAGAFASYKGRVHEEDWRIEAAAEPFGRSFLLLRLPNCEGEFSGEADAWALAGKHPDHPHQVVLVGGPEERELLAYGTRRLRPPRPGG